MKKILIVLLVALSLNLIAKESKFGVGIILGEPTGISAKLWQNEQIAYDVGVAWSIQDNESIHIHLDIVTHNFSLINSIFPIYYGIGGRVLVNDDPKLGIRVPIGIGYNLNSMPVDLFFEIVPTLDLLPSTGFGLSGAIGARYFF